MNNKSYQDVHYNRRHRRRHHQLGVSCFYIGELWILAVSGGLKSVTGYLGLTLVFVWDSAPQGRFNCYFLGL